MRAGIRLRTANQVWEAHLDIYGKVHTFAGRSLKDCPFKYQGQYEDSETGLYYNRFRYYDPTIGSYISQDPIGLAGGNPTIYGYVHDPNNWIDVLGLDCKQKKIGDWGEKWTKGQLENSGKYKKIIPVQNGSNYGIDLVGVRHDGKFDFFEVKTNTTGKVSPISGKQSNSSDFIKDILGTKKAQKGGWGVSPAEAQKMANPENWGDKRVIT
jgi:RHS repeat-associated protein